VRDEFDCKMRALAVEYAREIQPFRNAKVFADIADALDGTPEKAQGCSVRAGGVQAPAGAGVSRFPFINAPARAAPGGITVYVATTGSDKTGTGSEAAPFATLAAAVAATRKSPGSDVIMMRAGTYYQAATTVLTAADAGLTVRNYPGEEAWLSGARPLMSVKWAKMPTPPSPPPR